MREYICLACFHRWQTEESPRWCRCSKCGQRMGVTIELFDNLAECIAWDWEHFPPPPMSPPAPPLPDIRLPGAIAEIIAHKPSAAPLMPRIVAEAKKRADQLLSQRRAG